MKRVLSFLVVLLVGSSSAWAQDCAASLPDPGAAWTKLPVSEYADARVRQMAHVSCRGCQPEVAVIISAGPMDKPRSPSLFDNKTGSEFARTIYDNEGLRAVFLQDLLKLERSKAPGCAIEGQVNGITEVGGLGMIGTALRARCPRVPTPVLISGEYYGGYDGRCEFVAKVIWLGGQALEGENRDRVAQILRSVQWSR